MLTDDSRKRRRPLPADLCLYSLDTLHHQAIPLQGIGCTGPDFDSFISAKRASIPPACVFCLRLPSRHNTTPSPIHCHLLYIVDSTSGFRLRESWGTHTHAYPPVVVLTGDCITCISEAHTLKRPAALTWLWRSHDVTLTANLLYKCVEKVLWGATKVDSALGRL